MRILQPVSDLGYSLLIFENFPFLKLFNSVRKKTLSANFKVSEFEDEKFSWKFSRFYFKYSWSLQQNFGKVNENVSWKTDFCIGLGQVKCGSCQPQLWIVAYREIYLSLHIEKRLILIHFPLNSALFGIISMAPLIIMV